MHLLVEGINHRSAPLRFREQVFLSGENLRHWLRRLSSTPGLGGAAILSTCNRTEFFVCAADPEAARAEVVEIVRAIDASGEWARHSYTLSGPEAVGHLFRVPAGMDSAILGEAQILGQFKTALAEAREAGSMDANLDFLMRRAITVAKRVRTETAIGRNPVGFGDAAVAQARQVFGSLKQRSVLMVGAGKMAGVTARLLAEEGVARITFSSRTDERAVELASDLPGDVVTSSVPFGEVETVAARVDMVISSTSAPGVVFTRAAVEGLMRRRRHRPLFLLDLAVPRDIEAEVADVEDAYLYNVDDLGAAVERGLEARRRELPTANAIISDEVERTQAQLTARAAAPAIAELVDGAEAVRRDVIRRHLPGDLTDVQRESVEEMTRTLVARLLHEHITVLRDQGESA